MKLKKIIQGVVIGGSVIGLLACSSMHKNRSDARVDDANNGAQTSGIGDNANFGGEGNLSPEQLLAKRTYYFEFDRSEIKDDDRAAILSNADNLVAHSDRHVLLEGYTDPRGSREYNVALGERRANAVAELLKSKGVRANQIRTISYGSERLASPGRTEQDYEMDRRVVLVYLK